MARNKEQGTEVVLGHFACGNSYSIVEMENFIPHKSLIFKSEVVTMWQEAEEELRQKSMGRLPRIGYHNIELVPCRFYMKVDADDLSPLFILTMFKSVLEKKPKMKKNKSACH
jgi:hypothetical protein